MAKNLQGVSVRSLVGDLRSQMLSDNQASLLLLREKMLAPCNEDPVQPYIYIYIYIHIFNSENELVQPCMYGYICICTYTYIYSTQWTWV